MPHMQNCHRLVLVIDIIYDSVVPHSDAPAIPGSQLVTTVRGIVCHIPNRIPDLQIGVFRQLGQFLLGTAQDEK
jgi:hypothetical protein